MDANKRVNDARTSISKTYKENAPSQKFVIISFKNYFSKMLAMLSGVRIGVTLKIDFCFKIKFFYVRYIYYYYWSCNYFHSVVHVRPQFVEVLRFKPKSSRDRFPM
jgi:hypothetical protein